MYCVHLPWGLVSACLATHKTMEKPRMETFFFLFLPVKRICWKGCLFKFHIFFKIIMKDKWFNILQTYKITSKIRHYFQKLVTCNEKPSFRELKPVVIRTFHSISLVK